MAEYKFNQKLFQVKKLVLGDLDDHQMMGFTVGEDIEGLTYGVDENGYITASESTMRPGVWRVTADLGEAVALIFTPYKGLLTNQQAGQMPPMPLRQIIQPVITITLPKSVIEEYFITEEEYESQENW